jgi:hypothetical protein
MVAPAISTPLRRDAMAEVVTNDLVVRSRPGTGSDSEIYSPSVSAPTLVYVADGPVAADGFDWYLVAPVTAWNAVDSSAPSGWVAAGGQDGEPWIAPTSRMTFFGSCPFPSLEAIIAIDSGFGRLACFGNEALTLEGTFGGCGYGDVVSSSAHWLVNAGCLLLPPDSDPNAFGTISLLMRLTDHQIVADVQPGTPLRVEGHFDDPASAACVDEPPPPGLEDLPEIVVVRCRGEFVATRVTIVSE